MPALMYGGDEKGIASLASKLYDSKRKIKAFKVGDIANWGAEVCEILDIDGEDIFAKLGPNKGWYSRDEINEIDLEWRKPKEGEMLGREVTAQSNLETIEYILPSYWGPYLVNGDPSGMEDDEIAEIDKFMTNNNLPGPSDVSEESWFQKGHDANFSMGADVSTYTFLIPGSPEEGDQMGNNVSEPQADYLDPELGVMESYRMGNRKVTSLRSNKDKNDPHTRYLEHINKTNKDKDDPHTRYLEHINKTWNEDETSKEGGSYVREADLRDTEIQAKATELDKIGLDLEEWLSNAQRKYKTTGNVLSEEISANIATIKQLLNDTGSLL